jgi:hypothetical protein
MVESRWFRRAGPGIAAIGAVAVYYKQLTLPTNQEVYITVVAV